VKADEDEEVKNNQDKEGEEGGETASDETTFKAVVIPAEEEKLEVVQQVREKKMDDLTIPESESGGMNGIIKTEEKKESSQLEGEKPTTELEEEQPMSTDTDARKVDDGQTQYVGTLIWEEKMWTELVRIRKEMFYARLGVC
jgi:hypothetical protein